MGSDRGPWIQTYTGRAFYLLDPRPEDVCAEDIAHALSMQCRFAGHTNVFYSVAQHCVAASYMVPSQYALEALLHDAEEAYVLDLPRPLKKELPDYKALSKVVAAAIGEHFHVDLVNLPECVHEVDQVLLATERRDLLRESLIPWAPLPPPRPTHIRPMAQWDAKVDFLERLRSLRGQRAEFYREPIPATGPTCRLEAAGG